MNQIQRKPRKHSFLRGRPRSAPLALHLQVLQNGSTLIEAQVPVRRKGEVALSTEGPGAFCLPHYPLRDGRIEFMVFTREGPFLDVDQSWEGFCTSSGELIELRRGERGRHHVALKNGDYVSITESDLRIMVKVGPPTLPEQRPYTTDSAYRVSFIDHFLPTVLERRAALIGALAATVVLGGASIGLLGRPDDRPRQLSEVSDDYILPFIHPEHIKQAPEALQDHLDRRHLTRSVMEFYQTFTAALMGWNVGNEALLFPSTIKMYRKLHQDAASIAAEKERSQAELDRLQLMKTGVGVLTIPSVVGESLGASMLRVIDKIDILHESLRVSLTAKREIQKLFPHDAEYAWEEYKNVRVSDERSKALSEIKPFEQITDEEMMYTEAGALAEQARHKRRKVLRDAQAGDFLNANAFSSIGMPDNVRFASFATQENFALTDDKMNQLQGSEYGVARPQKHKVEEPLIGEIEPTLIERYIKENRFQLQLCYELALRRNEQASGTMEWRWRIDSRGAISEVALVNSSIQDTRMTECIRRKIAAWRFPRPRHGSVEISYPFEFAPAKG